MVDERLYAAAEAEIFNQLLRHGYASLKPCPDTNLDKRQPETIFGVPGLKPTSIFISLGWTKVHPRLKSGAST